MQLNKIKLELIPTNSKELAPIISYHCNCCEKQVTLSYKKRRIAEKLSGKSFYCNFCLRNYLHEKDSRNMLLLSFKRIIGFYYDVFYLTDKFIYCAEILQFIETHKSIGLENPLFRYDDENFMWVIDFSRVGKGRKKIPLQEIKDTILKIIGSFKITEFDPKANEKPLIDKYINAIDSFYEKRYRPIGKKILAPTLKGCGGVYDSVNDHNVLNYSKEEIFPY